MSRIFVKNLAKKATETDIRNHFASIGAITEARLILKEDGTSRRVAFVGFLEEASAAKAITKMNHTYIRTSRISVELARPRSVIEAEKKLREEEREKEHQERLARRQGGAREVIEQMRRQGGHKLEEYIRVTEQRSWEDNVVHTEIPEDKSNEGHDRNANESDSDVPDEDFAGNRPRNDGGGIQGAHDYEHDSSDSDEVEIDTARIKLTGLSDVTTEEHLTKHFATYGSIADATICLDKLKHKPTGVGFVTFDLPEAARKALKQRDTVINGKVVRILPARAIIFSSTNKEYFSKGLDKHNKLAWNPSYMRSTTVASTIAERLNLDQTAIASNAVGLAVAEAHLVEEAAAALKTHGILIANEALGAKSSQRSKTTILCKNLPLNTDIQEISQHFEQYGTVLKCIQPCPGFAIVEMGLPQDARKAFSMLAFKKIGKLKVPMFLEFAIMKDSIEGIVESENVPESKQETEDAKQSSAPKPKREAPTTIYIKNVSFSTSPDQFYSTVRALPKNISCRLVLHAHGHSGYGFAEFQTKEAAQQAMERLSNTTLDGHRWVATLARGVSVDGAADNDVSSEATTKLIIKNLAFQANGKELKQLVSQFGRVVAFRAPRKMDGRLRGFAFVQYSTEKEAETAFTRIKLTHFYGRHLVPEFTTEDQGLVAEDAYTVEQKKKIKR